MSRKQVKVIDIWGSPSSGKSTLAKACTVHLEYQGKAVSYVSEFIKAHVERGEYRPSPTDQLFIAGSQSQAEKCAVMAGYDYIFTDSSAMLCAWFNEHYSNHKMNQLAHAVKEWEYEMAKTYNVERQRVFIDLPDEVYRERYKPHGRNESYDEVLKMRDSQRRWLEAVDPSTILIHETNPVVLLNLLRIP